MSISTAYAEYQALAEAVSQCRYTVTLIRGLGFTVPTPTVLCDNSATLAIANADNDTSRTRYIDIRYHVVRQALNNKEVTLEKVDTERNIADMFTKSLIKQRFQEFMKLLFTPEGVC